MYNKLVLENLDDEFEIKFDWNFHIVPNGKFEAEETLWNFIFWQSRKWWININKLTDAEKPSVKKIEPVIKEVKEIVEEVGESIKETKETKIEIKEDKKDDRKEDRKFSYKL